MDAQGLLIPFSALCALSHNGDSAVIPGASRTVDQLELVDTQHRNAGLETCPEVSSASCFSASPSTRASIHLVSSSPAEQHVVTMSNPVTQIIYLTITADKDLTNSGTEAGKQWSEALRLLENHGGFRRLYWGRSPEDMAKVQLHVGA
jgi:hypothetical protein